MAYVAANYMNNPKAPVGQWVCAPSSSLGPFTKAPTGNQTKGTDLCGQCVSYAKRVCPSLPQTLNWKKGALVKNNKDIVAGTVIATFNASGKYEGHTAIYAGQTPDPKTGGIKVYDQWVTLPSPKAVGPRLLRWGAAGNSNNGDHFYVVD